MVAYASNAEAPEGQEARYMAVFKSTVASMRAREYCFVLTDASARTGKKCEEGGETDTKVLGVYGRDMLNENGKLLLGFAEDNKLALLSIYFFTPKVGCPKRSKSRTAARDKHVWTIS